VPLLTALDGIIAVLRTVFLWLALGLAVVALLDWLVRTRRLNPFGRLGQALRRHVDPAFTPIERRVVRAGGSPASAPWWALVFVIVGGIVVLSLLGFLRNQLVGAALATRSARGTIHLLADWTFGLLQLALVVRVVSSWFQLSPFSRWVHWSYVLSEPLLRPLRQIVPPLGMIDVTPLVAFIILRLLQSFFLSLL
jgi:YggT family protein